MEGAQPRQKQGRGRHWPRAPGVPVPPGLPAACVSWAGRPARSGASPLCERLSSTGPALHPGDSGPARKQADAGGAASAGWTVCHGLSAGAAGHVGALRGRHGERRLGGRPGKPTPYSVGGGPAWPRPARLSPDPRGSDLGPALTPRDASPAGRIPAAITSRPAAFPGTQLLSSQSQEDQTLICPELCQGLPPCRASHHRGRGPSWPPAQEPGRASAWDRSRCHLGVGD